MAEQCLNCPDVGARLEQLDREAVAERMACRALGKPHRMSGIVYGPPYCRFVQVTGDLSTGRRMGARQRSREELLPGEADGCSPHLRSQRAGQVALAAANREFLVVPARHAVKRVVQVVVRSSGEQGRPTVLPFFAAQHGFPSIEIVVVDANGKCFEEPEAASVEELADQIPHPIHAGHAVRLALRAA